MGVWTASRELGQDPGSMGVIRALCVRPLEEFAKTAVSALSSVGLGLVVSRDPVVGGPLTPPPGDSGPLLAGHAPLPQDLARSTPTIAF